MAEGISCSVGCTDSVASSQRSHVGLSTDPGYDRAPKGRKSILLRDALDTDESAGRRGGLSDPILAKALDIHVQLHVCAYPYLQVARPTTSDSESRSDVHHISPAHPNQCLGSHKDETEGAEAHDRFNEIR
jgi:hypothetical protein